MPIARSRPIDVTAEESYSVLQKSFVFIKKSQIKTWKAIFVIAFFAGVSFTGGLLISLGLQTTSRAAEDESMGVVATLPPMGKLMVKVGKNTPPSDRLVMGEENVPLAHFTLNASQEADLEIRQIDIFDTTNNEEGLHNIDLLLRNPQESSAPIFLGTAPAFFPTDTADLFGVSFTDLNTVLKKGQTAVLFVYADVNSYPHAVSGASHTISLEKDAIVYGPSGSSGIERRVPKSSLYVNPMMTYRTDLTASLSTNSPTGIQVPSSKDEVARFDFVANNAYDAEIESLTFTVSGDALPSAGSTTYYLVASDGSTIATTAYENGQDASLTFYPEEDTQYQWSIARGQSESYRIFVDSRNFSQGTTEYKIFQLDLANWEWSDGTSSGITPFSSEAPIQANTLQY